MKFFSVLVEKSLFLEYAETLDWLLCDGKFNKSIWDNKNKVQAFTKAIHKLKGFNDSSLFYDAKKNLIFPERGSYKDHTLPVLYLAKGESEARDLVRHIRNGIAHGNIEIYEINGRLAAEIIDFGRDGNETFGQTAYLLIPLEYIKTIYRICSLKEIAWKKGRKKK